MPQEGLIRMNFYYPEYIVSNRQMRQLYLNNALMFPYRLIAPDGRQYTVYRRTVFTIALTLRPKFARDILLSGIIPVDVDILMTIINSRGFVESDTLKGMVRDICGLDSLHGSSYGLTVQACIDVLGDVIKSSPNISNELDDIMEAMISLGERSVNRTLRES